MFDVDSFFMDVDFVYVKVEVFDIGQYYYIEGFVDFLYIYVIFFYICIFQYLYNVY